jgi:hypothetical protein
MNKLLTPTMFATQILLYTYKSGYYISTSNLFSFNYIRAFNWLEINGYVDQLNYNRRIPSKILSLTEKGISYIEKNFIKFLTTNPIRFINPILIPGDIIEVTEKLQNTHGIRYVKKPHTEIDAGRYFLRHVDSHSLLVNTHESSNTFYRVVPSKAKERLKLILPNDLNDVNEMTRRFGSVDIKTVSKKLLNIVPGQFDYIKLMQKLLISPVTRNRIKQ